MQVILTEDVISLGESGDIVEVSGGYFRNYLSPKRLAVVKTDGALQDRNKRLERIKQKAEKKHAADLAKAQKIEAVGKLTLLARATEHGKLFGAVTTKELATLVTEKSGEPVERKMLELNSPINKLGEYEIAIRFSNKVTAKLAVEVQPENEDYADQGPSLMDEILASETAEAEAKAQQGFETDLPFDTNDSEDDADLDLGDDEADFDDNLD
ncbi:MAG: 50S ribosomal protein L9 [Cyanobacteria bacterium HKST-UBA03]|nr:50S ribosomal protein L9 [Cyanobacteria bacterium HKST-UBA03]